MDISFRGENVFARGSVIGDLFIVTPKRGAHKALEIVKKKEIILTEYLGGNERRGLTQRPTGQRILIETGRESCLLKFMQHFSFE